MAQGVTIKWYDKRFVKEIEIAMVPRLEAAGELVASRIRRDISISTRANGPSLEGEKPHAVDGTLRKSITWERLRKLAVRVGSPVEYAVYLEQGTVNMGARPFILRTLLEVYPQVAALLTAPIK